jgi:ComF family protein
MREAIHGFKYQHHHELGRPLAQAMFAAFLKREDWRGRTHAESTEAAESTKAGKTPKYDPTRLAADLDLVVSVPMHYTRRWRRGYNHADVLAREFCALARLDYADDLLARIRRTPRQALLPEGKRAANVRGAFEAAADGRLHGQRVGLFDDVLTSCSTVNECARTLCAAGAIEVHVLALARA